MFHENIHQGNKYASEADSKSKRQGMITLKITQNVQYRIQQYKVVPIKKFKSFFSPSEIYNLMDIA